MPDFCEVTWSPTRAAAIVRMTVDEIPYDECDEAAHQLLACGNLARRINGKQRTDDDPKAEPATSNPARVRAQVTVTDVDPDAQCAFCGEPQRAHGEGLSGHEFKADD